MALFFIIVAAIWFASDPAGFIMIAALLGGFALAAILALVAFAAAAGALA